MRKILVGCPLLVTLSFANAGLITFDDLPGTLNLVPPGYAGLNWNNFGYLDSSTYGGNPSGYVAGTISPHNVAFNGYGQPALVSAAPFDLRSAYLTGAWNDGLNVQVIGSLGGTVKYDNTYVLSATAPTLINFNYLGVDSVRFVSSGGSPYWQGFDGKQFAMDNMVINGVPEPSTYLAGLGALGLLGLFGWRGRK